MSLRITSRNIVKMAKKIEECTLHRWERSLSWKAWHTTTVQIWLSKNRETYFLKQTNKLRSRFATECSVVAKRMKMVARQQKQMKSNIYCLTTSTIANITTEKSLTTQINRVRVNTESLTLDLQYDIIWDSKFFR